MTSSPGSAAAEQRALSGEVWRDFCRQLEAAGEIILRPETAPSAFDKAEGWRYLSRLARMGLEMMVEFADADFPVFYQASHDTVKIFAPNPDNTYFNATVSGERRYRIFGQRGSVPYLSFGSKANRFAIDGTMASTGELDAADMVFGPDGSFEILLGQQQQPGNWLPLAADSSMVLVRQTFLDRSREQPAQVFIECLDGPARPQPLTPAQLDRGLGAAGAFVGTTARMLADLAQRFAQAPNQLLAAPYKEFSMRTGGDPNIDYFHGYWQLGADEALVIDSEVPDCVYWNFQLNNYWMESLDYRHWPVCVNGHNARFNADGSVTLVVAARDPGIGNFIDTTGHDRGTMLLRWVTAATHPQPRCRVVPLASLGAG